MQKTALYDTPLWPAGHLPLKGGDRQFWRHRHSCNAGDWRKLAGQPISPLEGEMPGRAEGGVAELDLRPTRTPT
jgi:hypothetical protein